MHQRTKQQQIDLFLKINFHKCEFKDYAQLDVFRTSELSLPKKPIETSGFK